ncbi:hypothetical protein [Flavobacterium phragmitis]|uniref:Uncharacterized protein n=1 Tax=Flavobacterium phragmitis TaxID=739143 RepID=A0A1I1XPA8_9FLAO|nr:hypothetical protein [Flavobacterium phragmitis]SFE08488.1 hypothetical protein SAMN05216297_12027 [Flavobacterium phragmitis]
MDENLSDLILAILSENFDKHFTLEELTSLVRPSADNGNPDVHRLNQAEVLDQLLILDDQGLLELNPDTDRSCMREESSNKKITQLQISAKNAK